MDDYSQFYRELTGEIDSNEDVYSKLMNKEMHVLNTINKVIDHSNKNKKLSLLDQSPKKIMKKTFIHVYETFKDIQNGNKNIKSIFGKKHRIFYFGIFIVLIAIMLMIIYISEN